MYTVFAGDSAAAAYVGATKNVGISAKRASMNAMVRELIL
jgi:hypothetical protein